MPKSHRPQSTRHRLQCTCGNGRLPHGQKLRKSRGWYVCLALELLVILGSIGLGVYAVCEIVRGQDERSGTNRESTLGGSHAVVRNC